MCSYQPDRGSSGHIYAIKEDQESSIRLHFIKFETKYIEMCVNFIKDNILTAAHKDKALKATGNFKSLMESLKKFHEKKKPLQKMASVQMSSSDNILILPMTNTLV